MSRVHAGAGGGAGLAVHNVAMPEVPWRSDLAGFNCIIAGNHPWPSALQTHSNSTSILG